MPELYIDDFESWRRVARGLLAREVDPSRIQWREAADTQLGLALETEPEMGPVAGAKSRYSVPKEFIALGKHVACHRDPERWNLLYNVLWRMTHGERNLLDVEVDAQVHRLRRLDQAVRRDLHKMHAFVRFEKRVRNEREEFIAYFRPDFRIFRLAAPFFVERFRRMRWTIFGPDDTVAWDGQQLDFLPGVHIQNVQNVDDLTELWQSYYAAIFNPARLNVAMMRREMPQRFWPLLPETAQLEELVAKAPARTEKLIREGGAESSAPTSAKSFIPATNDLHDLASAAGACQGCALYADATQTIFGEGPPDANIVLVGEQPGDEEDRTGRPFVGPAGQILNELLHEAGIDPQRVYVTNTVKHFKWVPRGKRRLHSKPSVREVYSCRGWLEAELAVLKPKALVLLGATAAQAILGRQFRVQQERGQPRVSPWADWTIATYHPSAILRAREAAHALHIRESLLADLKLAAAHASLS